MNRYITSAAEARAIEAMREAEKKKADDRAAFRERMRQRIKLAQQDIAAEVSEQISRDWE